MPVLTSAFEKFSPALDRRRLAALMFTDIVGYSAIFHRDEDLAMGLLLHKCQILREIFPAYGGKEIKTLGDGFFIEFPSVLEAVKCAYEIQSQLYQRNLGGDQDKQFQIRIGIHLCDFIATEKDAFGNDVNISSRLEKIAPAGGICVSQQVVDQVSDKLDLRFRPIKTKKLKNIKKPVTSYSVDLPWQKPAASFRQAASSNFFSSLTWEAFALWTTLILAGLAGIAAWWSFLLPHSLSHYQPLAEAAKYVVILNPIFATTFWLMWLRRPSERRTLYLSIAFSVATLSLLRLIPGYFSSLGEEKIGLLNLFTCSLVGLPFISLRCLETGNRGLELGANFLFTLNVLAGLAFAGNLNAYEPIAAFSAAGTLAYFLGVVAKQSAAGKFSSLDWRRLSYTASSAILLLTHVTGGRIPEPYGTIFAFHFPVVLPLYLAIFIIPEFAQQQQNSREKEDAMKLVQKVSTVTSSADPYDDKLSRLQEITCHFLGAERSTIYLTDLQGKENKLRAYAVFGPSERLQALALEVDPGQGIIGRVWRTRSPLLIDDMEASPEPFLPTKNMSGEAAYRSKSCMLCPVTIGNEIVGVITYSDKASGAAFNEADLRLAQLVAKDIALLSVNMRFQNMIDHFVNEKLSELNLAA